MNSPHWPRKVREVQNHHIDSTAWNRFDFRPDDIVIATYAKSGTTWAQQIVTQLIFEGQEGLDVVSMSPWLDMRVGIDQNIAVLEAQKHRRVIKTHLPVDALEFSPQAKYLYVARDGRDLVWSMHNHHSHYNELMYQLVNETPGRIGPPLNPACASAVEYFQNWLEQNGYPWLPFWENVRSWWEVRELPNVLLIHFSDLKSDLPGQISRIAKFLSIPINPRNWDAIVEHCGFPYMKAHASQFTQGGGNLWHGGSETFVYKGTNGRWRGELSTAQSLQYEQLSESKLGRICANWLANGSLAGVESRNNGQAH